MIERAPVPAHRRPVTWSSPRCGQPSTGSTRRQRQVAAYHLGWVEADGRETSAVSGGKALRPALALLSARAAGAPAEAGIPGAVAVELVHNFSLLHDDLMDGDVQRRHRATVWAVWGASTAILVGDAMLALRPAGAGRSRAAGGHVGRARCWPPPPRS